MSLVDNPTILSGDVLSEMDVDSLLALDVNNVEEIKDFVPMPSGFFRFNVTNTSLEELGDDKNPAITVEFNLTECTELLNADNVEDAEVIATSFADGATVKHKESFFLNSNARKTAYGIRSFVTIFKGAVPEGQAASVQELMELSIGTSGLALIEKSSYIPAGKTEEERRYSSRIKPTAVLFD